MPEVRVHIDGHVATVTLDDAERRNALTIDLVDEIVATFDALETGDTIGAVVITGAGPAFCAGADLSDLGSSR
jgi:enoyl-CoA hydratase